MPKLSQILSSKDLGFIKILLDTWEIELEEPLERSAMLEIVDRFVNPEKVQGVIDTLPLEAKEALENLVQKGGRETWVKFTRKFGTVREMGPSKRDRERPFERENASTSELLWYRGLVSKGFFNTGAGPDEFVFIPDDLLRMIPGGERLEEIHFCSPASALESAVTVQASDSILDDVCTLLAGLRNGFSLSDIGLMFVREDKKALQYFDSPRMTPEFLVILLTDLGLLNEDRTLNLNAIGQFLEAERRKSLFDLVNTWLESDKVNELRMLPGLVLEGEWNNNPSGTRQTIIKLIQKEIQQEGETGAAAFWSLNAFIEAVKEYIPDYQRPSANYDSWYLREKDTGKYLRGFENWDAVDGELIRYLITGPMYWFGIVDLAGPEVLEADVSIGITAFRLSEWGTALLEHKTPDISEVEPMKLQISSDGSMRMPVRSVRSIRYQIARFCAWKKISAGYYYYQINARSLEIARNQGLGVDQFIGLLNQNVDVIPPNLVNALWNWEKNGSQAHLERVLVLRLGNPAILKKLRESPANRFLGDILGPVSVVVKDGAQEKILKVLAEMGFLGEIMLDE